MARPDEKLHELLSKWNAAFRNYDAALRRDEQSVIRTPPDDSPVVVALGETLREMFLTMIAGGSYRDTWMEAREIRWATFGHAVAFKSMKLDEEYVFGYDVRGFFLSTQIRYPEHLRRMSDAFWFELLSLGRLAAVEYQPNIPVDVKRGVEAEKKLRSKSEVFRIIRDVVLLESQEYELICDLGGIDVRWPATTDVDEVVLAGDHAMRALYKLNYQLYRAEYQLRHGREQSGKRRKS
jgi:hypothetical protein